VYVVCISYLEPSNIQIKYFNKQLIAIEHI